jgi:hypothetical protein
MASLIFGGEAELNMITAGEPHPSMLRYAQEQAAAIGSYIQRTGNAFAQGVVDAYHALYSDEALHRARVGVARIQSYFLDDRIRQITSIYEMQQAQPLMQRFIMAEPTIARMYDQGRCEGYGYTAPFPGKYGEDNYNWRRVMDGVIQLQKPTEDNPHGGWESVTYLEELMEGDRNLVLVEQNAILNTWESLKYSLARSMVDPTSKTGDSL